MTGQRDLDKTYQGSRLSLQSFYTTMRKYLVALSEVHYSLQKMYTSLFDEDLSIRPIDCREAMDTLEEMYALVHQYNTLLDDASLLSIAALATRYRLLTVSEIVLDQTRRLIDMFDSYQVMCLKPSPQAELMYKRVRELYQAVLKYISDIPRHTRYLEEESRSLEQDLIAALQEDYT
jgi:hypothetical protein